MNPAELSGVIHLDVVIRKYANEPRDACLSENVNGVNFHWQVLIALVVYGRHLETLWINPVNQKLETVTDFFGGSETTPGEEIKSFLSKRLSDSTRNDSWELR